MAMSVPRPNLNQGIEAGIMGARFGNDRGANMGFTQSMLKWQTTTAKMGNPRITYQYPILPTDNGWDSSWDNSTYLFLQKSDAVLKNAFSLETARYLMYQSAITRFDNDARLSASTSTVEQEALRMMPRGRGRNYGFLATIESIAENLEFIGSMIGPAEPGTAVGTSEVSESVMYSGNFKNVPAVIFGHGYSPNFWGDLQSMQDLWLIIKPMEIMENYYSPTGERQTVPVSLRQKRALISDFQFTSYRPMEMSSTKELYECKGEQPPIDTAYYIDWEYDAQGRVTSGTLKRGIVYHIGKANHAEKAYNGGGYVPSTKKAERLPWNRDYSKCTKQMEVLFDIKRIRAY